MVIIGFTDYMAILGGQGGTFTRKGRSRVYVNGSIVAESIFDVTVSMNDSIQPYRCHSAEVALPRNSTATVSFTLDVSNDPTNQNFVGVKGASRATPLIVMAFIQ